MRDYDSLPKAPPKSAIRLRTCKAKGPCGYAATMCSSMTAILRMAACWSRKSSQCGSSLQQRGKNDMANQRQMHLAIFWLGTGNHSAGWRMPNANFSNSEWSSVEAGAQMAERGKFDLFFVGDAVAMQLDLHPSFITRFEPTTLLAGLSRVTSKIGLGATVSTSF